jgi:bacterioferritin
MGNKAARLVRNSRSETIGCRRILQGGEVMLCSSGKNMCGLAQQSGKCFCAMLYSYCASNGDVRQNDGGVEPLLVIKKNKKEQNMKGNEKIIDKLNEMLADELTAINQYFLHAEMCANWRYEKLHEVLQKRAVEEMHHAEELMERIIFLEGMPVVSQLNPIHIGSSVEKQIKNDWTAEKVAVDGYNAAVKLAVELNDNGTRDLFESILNDEEDHIDWIEAQMDQIEQMGIQNYLTEQLS